MFSACLDQAKVLYFTLIRGVYEICFRFANVTDGNVWSVAQYQQCHLLCPAQTPVCFPQVIIFNKILLTFLIHHRLLLMLAVTDTLHLISSSLTFSFTNLFETYSQTAWYYVVPFSLPIAQVGNQMVRYYCDNRDYF